MYSRDLGEEEGQDSLRQLIQFDISQSEERVAREDLFVFLFQTS